MDYCVDIMLKRMKHFQSVFILVAAFVMAAGIGVAAAEDQSLRELRARQAEEERLQREAAFTGNVCNTRISARINWNASSRWPSGNSLAGACDGALSAVEAMCRGGKADRVRERIKSFECSGNGSGPSLSGSTLRYGARPGGDSFGETQSYLERTLN